MTLLTAPPPFAAGSALASGYEVLHHVSRGKTLDVYDAWSTERGCRVILKTPRPDRLDARVRRRLVREGELLCTLTHPHIVRAYEVVTEPVALVVLETLTGATLARLLDERRWRRLPLGDVGVLGQQLCSAVVYLHRQGVLHLDLKPANVIAEAGRAKLIDLSLARPPGRGRAGAGTRDYLSPEQAVGGSLTTATDVWGLGALLYDALTGHPPFDSDAEVAAGRGRHPQTRVRARPVASLRRRVPRALSSAIDASLDPKPARRPTVRALAAALRAASGVDLRGHAPS